MLRFRDFRYQSTTVISGGAAVSTTSRGLDSNAILEGKDYMDYYIFTLFSLASYKDNITTSSGDLPFNNTQPANIVLHLIASQPITSSIARGSMQTDSLACGLAPLWEIERN